MVIVYRPFEFGFQLGNMSFGQNIFQEEETLAVKGVHPFLDLFGIEWVVGFKALGHADFGFQMMDVERSSR